MKNTLKMHKILVLLIGVLFYTTIFSTNTKIELLLKQAEQAYKQKKYTESIQLYQEVIHQNYYSAELYYNLANAYFKNNQLGKAILYYEKARKINPSDEDISHNLKIAYSRTIDKIETKDNFFIEITRNNILNRLNTNTIAYISSVLSVLTAIFFALFLFFNKYKKVNLIFSVVTLFLTAILYIVGYAAQKSNQRDNFAIVTAKEVKATNEPLPDAIARFKLHEGTKVKILQKVDDFLLIRLENGIEAWIDEKTVERI